MPTFRLHLLKFILSVFNLINATEMLTLATCGLIVLSQNPNSKPHLIKYYGQYHQFIHMLRVG